MEEKINNQGDATTANNDEETSSEDSKSTGSSEKKEEGGPKGLEPTRYGDWERKGICYDF